MKKIGLIFVIVIIVLFAGVLLKDQMLKNVVKVSVSKVTGAPVEIDNFSLKVLSQSIKIEGFRIYQPKGFPAGILLDVPIVRVDYDIPSLLRGRIYLKTVELDVNEVGVVYNQEGALNVDALNVVQAAKKEKSRKEPKKEAQPETKKKEPAKEMALQIDELKLSVGKVVVSTYPKEGEPVINVFVVGMKDKVYKNITSPQQLAVLILSEPMKVAGIKSAGIYGAAAVLGMGLLPVGVAATFMGKDKAVADFAQSLSIVYTKSIEALKTLGEVVKEEKDRNTIKANVQGANITVQLSSNENGTTHVEVTARKLLLPKPEIAAGVIYELTERLK